jgi:DASS family divalent anion:Na+ symporter
VKTSEWFRIGFVMSVMLILIWTVLGGAWLKVLGIW